MGRISKIKRELIMESNKRLLGEDTDSALKDEIHDKILYVSYLSQRFQKVEDFIEKIIELIENYTVDTIEFIEDELGDVEEDEFGDVEDDDFSFEEKQNRLNVVCDILNNRKEGIVKKINEEILSVKNIVDIMIELNKTQANSTENNINEDEETTEDSNNSIVPYNPNLPATDSDDEEFDDYEEIIDDEEVLTFNLPEINFNKISEPIKLIFEKIQSNSEEKLYKQFMSCYMDYAFYPLEKTQQAKDIYNYLLLYYSAVNEKIELINKYKSLPNKDKELDELITILINKLNKNLIVLLEKIMETKDVEEIEKPQRGYLKRFFDFLSRRVPNEVDIERIKDTISNL
jgi:hypothetical protein